MSVRTGLLGLAGVVAVAGFALAKPPELPDDPHVQGRELDPVVREFYEAEAVPPVWLGARSSLPTRPMLPPPREVEFLGMTEFVNGLHDTAFERITMPLGTVPVNNPDDK